MGAHIHGLVLRCTRCRKLKLCNEPTSVARTFITTNKIQPFLHLRQFQESNQRSIVPHQLHRETFRKGGWTRQCLDQKWLANLG
jgi:hypothetical protein